MAEVYATGPNGERYKRKADYQAERATKAKSARQRERRVYSSIRGLAGGMAIAGGAAALSNENEDDNRKKKRKKSAEYRSY